MSMLKHRDEFLELDQQSGTVFEPSKPTQESDNLDFTYTNKPEGAEIMTDEACICYLENISKMFERGKENCAGDALELQQKHIDALQYAIKEMRKNR